MREKERKKEQEKNEKSTWTIGSLQDRVSPEEALLFRRRVAETRNETRPMHRIGKLERE